MTAAEAGSRILALEKTVELLSNAAQKMRIQLKQQETNSFRMAIRDVRRSVKMSKFCCVFYRAEYENVISRMTFDGAVSLGTIPMANQDAPVLVFTKPDLIEKYANGEITEEQALNYDAK